MEFMNSDQLKNLTKTSFSIWIPCKMKKDLVLSFNSLLSSGTEFKQVVYCKSGKHLPFDYRGLCWKILGVL